MNNVFVLLASLMLRLSMPHGPAGHAARLGEFEKPVPTVDSLQAAATRRTAYLADALQLRYAQTLQVKRSTHAQLQALDSLRFAAPAAYDAPAQQAAIAGIGAGYQRALARTLTAAQYEALLRLEAPEAPAAVILTARK
ncbi:hypothetical protein MON38_05785 [Hymenobacter sp. DH14]|uniref:Uncharacterized protein n=1 Tax=Hymenobacter cyanobacteriorum TaxID=2926463 RepID=A0A9X2AFU9_9BACT|nr:hypothetical protein [Hymenobacter cyanobacteriorum]MCI1186923.1 hypothetical protein [Hymenobacter cyanobacteriorum]